MSIPQKACSLCYHCAENFYNPSKFGKVMTKNKFAQFFLRHGVYSESSENFQDTHIWGALRGRLCHSTAFLLIFRYISLGGYRPSICYGLASSVSNLVVLVFRFCSCSHQCMSSYEFSMGNLCIGIGDGSGGGR